jgi:hypothetical protein
MRPNFLLIFLFTFLQFFSTLGFSQVKLSKEEYQKIMDEKFGFRGVKLESSIQNLGSNLQLIISKDGGLIKTYRRNNESKISGKTKFQFVEYMFFKGKLLCIIIRLEGGKENSDSFATMFDSIYGPWHTVTSSGTSLVWESSKMSIQWEPNPDGDDIKFITNGLLKTEYDSYKKAKELKQNQQGLNDF